MNRYAILISVLLLLFGCRDVKQPDNQTLSVQAPIEAHEFKQLTSNKELIQYLNKADSLSELITVSVPAKSVEGKDIPLVKISHKENIDNEKLTIFFFAQQHGDEPSGKEGLLLLINEILQGKHNEWIEHVDLLIMPQVNPDGGDENQRRNANGIDLNRDHLEISSPEVKAVHDVFQSYTPEVTVDVHEYDPYSSSWREFGYLKDFDIQLGGMTNKNVDSNLKQLFYDSALPFVEDYVTEAGYSFFEYTLGDLPNGKRLRRSTVDVNDGRQSFGILNTFSFIVEGKYGKDSVDHLERRAKSQLRTAKGLITFMIENQDKVKNEVKKAREKLKHSKQGEKVAIRMHHVKGDKSLKYPLKSIKTGNDTVFQVKEYHSKVISKLDVTKPTAYLIPANDEKLVSWMKRFNLDYNLYQPAEGHVVSQYAIQDIKRQVDEGLENYFPKVQLQPYKKEIGKNEYYAIPINQLHSNKIVTALEPQSMLGLVNYDAFEYLLVNNSIYPVLRMRES
ncbi:MAG: M14 family zinc carboxypeptidase [Bacteroidota bacterium]